MFSNIIVFNRGDAEKFAKEAHKEGSVIISIRSRFDPSMPYLKLTDNNGVKEILFLEFNDAETEQEGGITYSDAKKIAEFIRHVAHRDDVNTVVVHCDAGSSRSPGVAAAIAKYYFGDDSKFFERYTPNHRCYSLIIEELFCEDTK